MINEQVEKREVGEVVAKWSGGAGPMLALCWPVGRALRLSGGGVARRSSARKQCGVCFRLVFRAETEPERLTSALYFLRCLFLLVA